MKEIWKNIQEYEGLYQISTKGRVRSFMISRKGYILKPGKHKDGYLFVALTKKYNNRTELKSYSIARLAALVFIKNSKKKPCVNHKDGNKENNCITNLEWVTHQENMQHAAKTGLMASGERSGKSRFTNKIIKKIRNIYKQGKISQRQLAKIYSTQQRWICKILNYKAWKHI